MKEKNKIRYLILIIVILILIAINLYVFINNYFDKNEAITESNNIQNVEINTNYVLATESEDEENRINKIASLTEQQRM